MWIAKMRETMSKIFQLQKFYVAGEFLNAEHNFGWNIKINSKIWRSQTVYRKATEISF